MAYFRCKGNNIVKSLKSTGLQQIALPVYNDDYPIIEFKLYQTKYTDQGVIIGDGWTANSVIFYMLNNKNEFRYSSNGIVPVPMKTDEWIDVKIDYSTGILTYDGIEYGGGVSTKPHNQIKVFGFSSHYTSVEISDIKIYKNNELFMHLIPKSDISNEGYYYDLVGGQNYYSTTDTPLLYMQNHMPVYIKPSDYPFKDEYTLYYDEKVGKVGSTIYRKINMDFRATGVGAFFVKDSSNRVWAHPLVLISDLPADVEYVGYDGISRGYYKTVTINNKTYYVAKGNYLMNSSSIQSNPANSIPLLNTYETPFENYDDGIDALIAAALK